VELVEKLLTRVLEHGHLAEARVVDQLIERRAVPRAVELVGHLLGEVGEGRAAADVEREGDGLPSVSPPRRRAVTGSVVGAAAWGQATEPGPPSRLHLRLAHAGVGGMDGLGVVPAVEDADDVAAGEAGGGVSEPQRSALGSARARWPVWQRSWNQRTRSPMMRVVVTFGGCAQRSACRHAAPRRAPQPREDGATTHWGLPRVVRSPAQLATR